MKVLASFYRESFLGWVLFYRFNNKSKGKTFSFHLLTIWKLRIEKDYSNMSLLGTKGTLLLTLDITSSNFDLSSFIEPRAVTFPLYMFYDFIFLKMSANFPIIKWTKLKLTQFSFIQWFFSSSPLTSNLIHVCLMQKFSRLKLSEEISNRRILEESFHENIYYFK